MKININPDLTKRIIDWLAADYDDADDIRVGAEMLLSVNHDVAMFSRLMRNPKRHVEFIKYKLEKIVNARIDGFTVNDIVELDKQITPVIQEAVASIPEPTAELPEPLPVTKGMRPDHEQLPEHIKQLWTDNAERWHKIKQTFETCKSVKEPCDRYEYLKVLKEAWYAYRDAMTAYDSYSPDDNKPTDTDTAPELSPDDVKAINNARSYISKNLAKLSEPVAGDDDTDEQVADRCAVLRVKIQERVDTLLQLNAEIGEDLRKSLLAEGLNLTLTLQDNGQGA